MLQNCSVYFFTFILVLVFAHLSLAHRGHCFEEVDDELPGYELVLAQTFWRHGERGPNGTYPNDPNKEDKWDHGWEELTLRGMVEMNKLGKIFRQRYILDRPFLSRQYKPKEIYVRSTDLNRILASAEIIMAAIYTEERSGLDIPSKKESCTWPANWVPVPVHAPMLYEPDRLPSHGLNCPLAEKIIAEIRNSSKHRQIAIDNKDFLAYVSEKAGVTTPYTMASIYQIHDVARREMFNNLPQPDWFTNEVYEHVKKLANYVSPRYNVFAPWAIDDKYIRLQGGPILKEVVDRSTLKFNCLAGEQSACESVVNDVQKIKDLKFYFYSVHGSTLASIAYTLNLNDQLLGVPNDSPMQSASIIFEFWAKKQKENNQSMSTSAPPMIRILYRKSVYVCDYQTVTGFVPGCNGSDFCSYEAFKQTREKYLPIDIEKECEI